MQESVDAAFADAFTANIGDKNPSSLGDSVPHLRRNFDSREKEPAASVSSIRHLPRMAARSGDVGGKGVGRTKPMPKYIGTAVGKCSVNLRVPLKSPECRGRLGRLLSSRSPRGGSRPGASRLRQQSRRRGAAAQTTNRLHAPATRR